jgi:CBS domain-containing protein
MGEFQVGDGQLRGEELRRFMSALLDDLRALEKMSALGMIEADKRRIGAEQELFLVDRNWRPAAKVMEILGLCDDPHFVTELGMFNLEINIDPLDYGGDCLRQLESQLTQQLAKARALALATDCQILMTGILPTLRETDLVHENMTPKARYYAIDRALRRLRGAANEFRIRGIDELILTHDSVLIEACNASFQVHFQAGDREFARLYNIAQFVTAPVMAVAVNSPLLFGRRLWHETRIALFQQAVDTRASNLPLRDRQGRVSFGRRWLRESVLELYQEDIGRFKALIGTELDEDPLALVEQGIAPKLRALQLFNGTVWRWNRACYGITNGKPHLRIENRVLPSGPTIIDQVANAAFWFGLIGGFAEHYQDITRLMRFEDVKANFDAAAMHGLSAQFRWTDGQTWPARELLVMHLLPLAREGLKARNIDAADIDRYLGVIEERTTTGRTGARWMLDSLEAMPPARTVEKMSSIVAATLARQATEEPVHTWSPATLTESGGWKLNFRKVEHLMTTDLVTVFAEEPVTLAASLMHWERVRHIPVEDHDHRLVGLVSYWGLLRFIGRGGRWVDEKSGQPIPVSEVMKREVHAISPDASTLDALEMMRRHQISCLPVTIGERLVGVITEADFMDIASQLLQQQLREEG